jgi:hypothetical protein
VGAINEYYDDALQRIVAPKLDSVVGTVEVYGLEALEAVSLPALREAGSIDVSYNASLTKLDLSALTAIDPNVRQHDAHLSILGDAALATIALPALTTVKGTLSFSGRDALRSISAPVLTEVTDLEVDNMPAVGLSFPALRTIAGTLTVSYSELVDLRAFAAVQQLGGLDLDANPPLASLTGLEAITKLTGALTVTRNPALTSLAALANLTSVGGQVEINEDSALPQSEIDALLARLQR